MICGYCLLTFTDNENILTSNDINRDTSILYSTMSLDTYGLDFDDVGVLDDEVSGYTFVLDCFLDALKQGLHSDVDLSEMPLKQ